MGDSPQASLKNVDRFLITKILGEGGQGIVYLAHDPKLNREVAIKTLTATTGDDMQSLLQEARAVSALQHPSIVPVFEAGEFDGVPFLVFEYVTGETLQARIKRGGALAVEHTVKIAAQVLDGLAHAHAQGVLHRDIKPANIMLGSDGTSRIMDFGAATRTHISWLDGGQVAVDEDLIGTLFYMAPEYIERKLYSARTDIFAVGLVICEMLTGERVFKSDGGSIDQLLHRIVHDPLVLPPSPGLSEKLVACLLKAMAKDPQARYGSVVELKDALQQATEPEAREPASAEGRGTLEFLLRRIKLKKEFPAMSESITKVNSIIFSDSGSVTTLTNAVLKDFALTNKIIKLANSSFYNASGRGGVGTISGAVYRLGFDTIRNIILGLLLFENLKDRNQANDLMDECMRAVLGGAIAKEISISQGCGNPEETFVCAMMHNLGRMLSIYYFPEETLGIRNLLEQGGISEEQASRRVLGASYTQLGQGVSASWGFPQKIIGSMDKQPPAEPSRRHASADETMRLIVCMACELSAAVVDGDPDGQRKRTDATLEKYKAHLKLGLKAAATIFASSVKHFKEYSVAVGWKFDRTLVRKFDVFQKASEQHPATDSTLVLQTRALQTQDIEKTLRVESSAGVIEPPRQSLRPAPGGRDVLSGGIQDITNALVEGRGLNDILRIIIETIYTGIGFDHVIFALRDPKRSVMAGRFGLGEGIDALVRQFSFPLEFSPDVFHVALQRNTDIFISDTGDARISARIPAWYSESFSAGAFILFPIIVRDRPFGMIYADSGQANSVIIREDEVKPLHTLRNQAVLAIRQST